MHFTNRPTKLLICVPLVPLLRLRAGRLRRDYAWIDHGDGRGLRSAEGVGVRPQRALHGRCYGVPTMFIAELNHPMFDMFDLQLATYRHYGRSPLPDRDDEAGHGKDVLQGDYQRLRPDGGSPGMTAYARDGLDGNPGDHR